MRKKIVVDWGTSNFRAYRFLDSGALAEEHHAAAGILQVKGDAFETALEHEIGHWLGAGCDVFLSGMITSRNGWLETPYVEAPAELLALSANARQMQARSGAMLRFLPGVAVRAPLPDVMRGEEIQVFGATGPNENATVVLPGTHSKWVRVQNGRITTFRTFLTGELYALLRAHSIIGRLIPGETGPFIHDAFLVGVRQAQDEGSCGILQDVFTARSGALLGSFAPGEIADRLSGLVIGHELRAALKLAWNSGPIRLVGDLALCQRYQVALSALGQPSELGPKHAAVAGFERLAALKGSST